MRCTHVCQCALWMVGGLRFNQHVRARSDNGWVDEAQEEETANKSTDGRVVCVWVLSLGQTSNLFANPANTVWNFVDTSNDDVQKLIGQLHQSLDSGCYNLLNFPVLSRLFDRDTLFKVIWEWTTACFYLLDHVSVNPQRVDFQVEILDRAEAVDLL